MHARNCPSAFYFPDQNDQHPEKGRNDEIHEPVILKQNTAHCLPLRGIRQHVSAFRAAACTSRTIHGLGTKRGTAQRITSEGRLLSDGIMQRHHVRVRQITAAVKKRPFTASNRQRGRTQQHLLSAHDGTFYIAPSPRPLQVK